MADSYEINLEIQGGEQPALVMETESGATDGASARNAEAWANGTRNGVPVEEGDPAYNKSSKYYRDSAAAIAAGDVIDDDAGHGDYDLTWSADKLVGEFGGKHEDFTAGNAIFLLSDRGETDNEPYAFRKTGGSKNAYGREMLKKVVGGTIAWNEQVKNGNFADSTGWTGRNSAISVTSNVATLTVSSEGTQRGLIGSGTGATIPIVTNHVYLLSVNVKSPIDSDIVLSFGGINTLASYVPTTANTWKQCQCIIKSDTTDTKLFYALVRLTLAANSEIQYKNAQCFDLTQMFGSTIADAIYEMEQATAGAGVAWFRSLFPKSYYAYDAGTLMSVKAESHALTGFNQWDKTNIENGYIDDSDGIAKGLSAGYKHTGYTAVIPGETYYIKSEQTNSAWGAWYDGEKNYLSALASYSNTTKTAPANARYMRLTIVSPNSGNADTVCINISDTVKNGTYEPYQLRSYPLANVELRGVPKWKNGQLVFDGDEYTPDGTVKRRYGIVDLGTLTWTYDGVVSGVSRFHASPTNLKVDTVNLTSGLVAENYTIDGSPVGGGGKDKTLCRYHTSIYVNDSAYSSAADFKTAMSGVYLVYELATPTTESADPYHEIQISNRNGTEEFVDRAEEAGTRDVAIPVGTETFYPVDIFALIDALQAQINS